MSAGDGSAVYPLPPPQPNGISINLADLMPPRTIILTDQMVLSHLQVAGVLTANEARAMLTLPPGYSCAVASPPVSVRPASA